MKANPAGDDGTTIARRVAKLRDSACLLEMPAGDNSFFPLDVCLPSMPIRLKCPCGKALQVPDQAAGKVVQCPACSKSLRVPGGTASGAPTPQSPAPQSPALQSPGPQSPAPQSPTQRPPAQRPAAAQPTPQPASPAAGGLGDIFDEEGFSNSVAAVCPSCRKEMPAGAVLCMSCGYHMVQGIHVAGHKTPGVDISMGDMALEKAKQDMFKADEMQRKMIAGSGAPVWLLALVLTLLVGFAAIGVIALNQAQRAEQNDTVSTFNATATFMAFAAICCGVVGNIAFLIIVYRAFRQDVAQGFLTLLVPLYVIYFVFKNWSLVGKVFVTQILVSAAAIGFWIGVAMTL
ncbi:MAG: hypothetical protein AAF958_17550 [Planctomycetota bacterium]